MQALFRLREYLANKIRIEEPVTFYGLLFIFAVVGLLLEHYGT